MDSQTSKLRKGKGESPAKTILVKEGDGPLLEADETDAGQQGESREEDARKPEISIGEGDGSVDQPGADAEEWWSGYYKNWPTYVIHVFQPGAIYKNAQQNVNGRDLSDKSPLVFIDSGASLSVAGEKWLQCWTG